MPFGLLNVFVGTRLVCDGEDGVGVLGDPQCHLNDLLAESANRLLVHVCLGDELGQVG